MTARHQPTKRQAQSDRPAQVKPCVLSDERGAVMIIAVFMAIFLIAILYYTIGIGQSILHAEAMQDAADAGTLSAAIMHARGMNFIVLLNVVMAAIMSILIVLRLVEGLAMIGILVAAALSWVTFGASAALIPPLNGVRTAMQEAYSTLEPPISAVVRVLHTVADGVRVVVPLAAEASMHGDAATQASSSPVKLGFFIPQRPTLLVVDDDPKVLCQRSGSFVVGLAFKPLNDAGINLGPIQGALEEAVSGLTGALSSWFCGEEGSAAPVYEKEVKRVFPQTPDIARCEKDYSESACNVAAAERESASPNKATGQCQTQCERGGPYDRFIELARTQCQPSRDITEYGYQVVTGRVEYRYLKGAGWVRGEPRFETPALVRDSAFPCGSGGHVGPRFSAEYNLRVHAGASDDVLPVCSDERMPEPPDPLDVEAGKVEPKTVRFTEVMNILECVKPYVTTIDLGKGSAHGAARDGAKATKTLEPSVAMGGEDFQIRGVVLGKNPSDQAERIMHLAAWGRAADAPDPAEHLRFLGRFGVAQAEYFYEGKETPAEQMWNMNWRARLVRFRAPSENDQSWRDKPSATAGVEDWGGSSSITSSPCGPMTGELCQGFSSLLERAQAVIVH